MTMSDGNPMLDFLLARRSAGTLGAPGPTHAQLDQMLLAAGTVPDHGRLRPFRFAIVERDGRAAFDEALARVAAERRPESPATALDKMREKAQRSPTIIVVIASPKPGKIEVWEQHVAAACAGYAITLAAYALGVGAVWKSVPFTRGTALTELFGLAETEEMLGWIHLGTPATGEPPVVRPALDLSAITTLLDGAGTTPYRS
ncbi:MAG: nitroreductase [Kofleriaceae bacterium]